LPVVTIEKKVVREVEAGLPETPDDKLKKLLGEFSIDKKNAEILTKNLELVEFVEGLGKVGIDVHKNISWITIELLRVLNYNKKNLDDSDVDIRPEHLGELLGLVAKGEITVLKAKQVMNDFVPKSFSVLDKGDIGKIADDAVVNFAKQVIDENQKAVDDYKRGEENALNFLVGQVMRKSERRADFKTAREELIGILKKDVNLGASF